MTVFARSAVSSDRGDGATTGSDTTTYIYTPDDVLFARIDGNGTLNVRIGEHWESDGTTTRTNYRYASSLIAVRTQTATTNTLTHVIDDTQGTVSVVHTLGGTTGRVWYDPWGLTRATTGTASPTPHGYTGQHSEPSGLIDYRARQYDPGYGRFTSPDTIIPDPTNPQDLNRYAYTRNNPATNTDPTGHITLQRAVGGAVISAVWAIMTTVAQLPQVTDLDNILDGLGLGVSKGGAMPGFNNDTPKPQPGTQLTPSEGLLLEHPADNLDDIRNLTMWAEGTGDDSGGGPDSVWDVEPNRGNLKRVQANTVEEALGLDEHQLKRDVLGKTADISAWEIYKDGQDLWLLEKATGTLLPTYLRLPGG